MSNDGIPLISIAHPINPDALETIEIDLPVDTPIFAVTGVPRSGTSMVMAMLEAAGLPVVCEPETRGTTYESRLPLGLPYDHKWLNDCRGKAIKIQDIHEFCPPMLYKFVFFVTHRDPLEVAQSQLKLLQSQLPKGAQPDVKEAARAVWRMRDKAEADQGKIGAVVQQFPDSMSVLPFGVILGVPFGVARDLAGMIKPWFPDADPAKMAAVVRT